MASVPRKAKVPLEVWIKVKGRQVGHAVYGDEATCRGGIEWSSSAPGMDHSAVPTLFREVVEPRVEPRVKCKRHRWNTYSLLAGYLCVECGRSEREVVQAGKGRRK